MQIFRICILIFILSISISAQWHEQNSGTTDILDCVFFISKTNGWIGTHHGKILKTTDSGNAWQSVSTGTSNIISSIYFVNDTLGWCVATSYYGSNMIFKTNNGGLNWNEKYSTDVSLESIYFVNENIGFAVGVEYFVGGLILKTIDGGETWINTVLGNPDRPADVYFLNENTGFVVGGQPGRIYKTENGGQSWDETIDSTSDWFRDISFANDSCGIAVGLSQSLIRTENAGYSWSRFHLGTYDSFYGVSYKKPYVWMAGGIYILNSTDDGNNWFPQYRQDTTSLTDIFFVNDSTGWAVGTSGIILNTTNRGIPLVGEPQIPVLFHPKNNSIDVGIPVYFQWGYFDYSVYQIQIATDSLFSNIIEDKNVIDTLYGTYLNTNSKYYWHVKSENTNGFSKWSDTYNFSTGLTAVHESNKNNYNLKLEQNYPNPFNLTTNIGFWIANFGFVTLKIYDILGREVATLVNAEKNPGTYEVKFDGSKLASGIYIYRLQAGSFIQTKKLILIK